MNRKSNDLHFVVPPGIGDTWWCYQKFHALRGKRDVSIELCCDPPLRSEPFGIMLPGVTSVGYGTRRYGQMLPRILKQDTDLVSLKPGTYEVSLNPFLDEGRRIETIFPKQETGFHLPLYFTPAELADAKRLLARAPTKKLIGVYCSSNRMAAADAFWSVSEWVHFLRFVSDCVPNASFVMIGTTWDQKTAQVSKALRSMPKFPVIDCMNQPLAVTLAMIKSMNYFFAYPSGLGIMADNFRVPSTMWFWTTRHPKFPGCYTSPESAQLGRHLVPKFSDVRQATREFTRSSLKWLEDENVPSQLDASCYEALGVRTNSGEQPELLREDSDSDTGIPVVTALPQEKV